LAAASFGSSDENTTRPTARPRLLVMANTQCLRLRPYRRGSASISRAIILPCFLAALSSASKSPSLGNELIMVEYRGCLLAQSGNFSTGIVSMLPPCQPRYATHCWVSAKRFRKSDLSTEARGRVWKWSAKVDRSWQPRCRVESRGSLAAGEVADV
jgi:hypothetical protein